jgi:hypothetical protein
VAPHMLLFLYEEFDLSPVLYRYTYDWYCLTPRTLLLDTPVRNHYPFVATSLAGAGALSSLLSVPGASGTVLGALVTYARSETVAALGCGVHRLYSTARDFAHSTVLRTGYCTRPPAPTLALFPNSTHVPTHLLLSLYDTSTLVSDATASTHLRPHPLPF